MALDPLPLSMSEGYLKIFVHFYAIVFQVPGFVKVGGLATWTNKGFKTRFMTHLSDLFLSVSWRGDTYGSISRFPGENQFYRELLGRILFKSLLLPCLGQYFTRSIIVWLIYCIGRDGAVYYWLMELLPRR